MFPSSSIPQSILSPQTFLNSPSSSSSSSMLPLQQFPAAAAGDFSGLALLQLILGTNNALAKHLLPLESLHSPNFGSSNLLLNSSPTIGGLLQSLQFQQQLAAMEQQQRQQREQREQQQQMAALALQCIQQLLAGGGTNSPILLDKEGLLDDAPSSLGFAKSGQKCSNGLQSVEQFGGILQQPPHFADPPDPPPPPSSTSSSNSTFSVPSKLAVQGQKTGRKRKMPEKIDEEKANEGKIEGDRVEKKEAENEEGEKKRQPRKRRKRRRHEAETDSPVSGMFITDHWDAAECLQHDPRILLDESAAFVHVSEAARRTIAGLPNVIGEPCCALCRIRFDDVFRLAMHKCPRIRHTEYRCRECEKVFSCPANLASHRRWHKPEASRNAKKSNVPMKGNESDGFGANAANGGKNSEGVLLSNKTLAQEAANALITLGLVK